MPLRVEGNALVWNVPPRATLAGLERGDYPDRDWPPGATAREAIEILAERYRRGEPVRSMVGHEQPDGRVTLLVGHLRYAACMAAGITEIPVYVLAASLDLATVADMLAQIRASEVRIPTKLDPQDGQHRGA